MSCAWAQTASVSIVHSFAPLTGTDPAGLLTKGNDGDFYGTTSYGGANGNGTVFKMTPGGVLTTLYSFSALDANNENQDGAYPVGALALGSDGNFYGAAYAGGTGGNVDSDGNPEYASGTIFKITPAGGLTTLYRFAPVDQANHSSNAQGAHPSGLILGSDGNFYGVTPYGGTGGSGTVFEMTSTGSLSTLHRFATVTGDNSTSGNDINTDGAYPGAPLLQGSDGSYYGTTGEGGTTGGGTIFKITSAGVFTSLHTFSTVSSTYVNNGGANPVASLVQGSDGDFYGTAGSGGTGATGTVFKLTSAGTLTTVYNFSALGAGDKNQDGSLPLALTIGSDGNFYGVAEDGGAAGKGTVFKLTPAGVLTVLHSFSTTESLDGDSPDGLVLGSDGNFYGTASDDNVTGAGTAFRITPGGTLTTLLEFGGNVDGIGPESTLVKASNGDLYGTTASGGTFNSGTVFQMTPSGAVSVLHHFTDGNPPESLIQGTDGNFYGKYSGGSYFKLTSAGVITPFSNLETGNGFMQGTDGNFYGTSDAGGTSGDGIFFKINSAGAVTILHSFSGTAADGAFPENAVLQARDGNFYGTTSSGGANSAGTVFKATPAGVVTTLYNFRARDRNSSTNSDGVDHSALIQATDGNFYGTADGGGTYGTGLVFEVTPAGAFTVLHNFSAEDAQEHNSDGAGPRAALVQGADGNLYGTAKQGGADGAGTVFEITTAGVLTTLHSFGATAGDGDGPDGPLILDNNGDLVGTTASGGVNDNGTTFSVTLAPVIISALTATASVGQAFSYQITATGSPTSYAAPGLPTGLTLNAITGLLSGTPKNTGTAVVTLSATNAVGKGSAKLTITLLKAAAPVITSAISASATVGTAFSYQITATGSPTSYAAPGLPTGLSLNATTGKITGTPKNAGKAAVTISATNATGTGTAKLTITITAS